MPPSFMRGRDGPDLFGEGASGLIMFCCSYSGVVRISVATMDRRTETMTDPLDTFMLCTDIKGTAGPHRHAPDVAPLFGPGGNHRPHQIAGLKALDLLRTLGF